MKISTVLDNIDQGNVALPEFQRGYVWGRDQVRELMRSLYRRYPVGGLLVWETNAETTAMKGTGPQNLVVRLLLDGQQRVTTLYGVMRGHAPTFFQGDVKAFTDLYFHLEDETFEFYGPVKMKADQRWIDITELYKSGLSPWFSRFPEWGLDGDTLSRYAERLSRLLTIADIDLHLDEIAPNLSVDEVVEVFNRVNSGGTKLSKGDLALARICAAWPDARKEMLGRLEGWQENGYDFTLDWLLRVTNAILTGEALFTALKDVEPSEFRIALTKSGTAVDQILNLVAGRLGLDHDRVLGGRYAVPVMARYWASMPAGSITDAERGKLLYWYVHAALWGRHSGSTESMLDQDLEALDSGGLDGLIEQLRMWRGDLTIQPENLRGSERGSRFYPLLYLLARVHGARDLGTGNPLSMHLLGKLSRLELHHLFPKALLQENGYGRADRNALANFCFLTQETNLAISKRAPAEYLPEYEAKNPGVLKSQWIPSDRALWELDRYPDFLEERRRLLADSANGFLASLLTGGSPEVVTADDGPIVLVDSDPNADRLTALRKGAVDCGLAEADVDHEIVDPESGEMLAFADLAWPDGLRVGLTEPVAFLAERDDELELRLGELGWRFYTDEVRLRQYFEEIVGVDLDGDGVVGPPEEVSALSDTTAPATPPPAAASEAEFHHAMIDVYQNAKKAGYNANYFIQSVSERGGLATARDLVNSTTPSQGFTALWDLKRLDLSLEAVVLQPRFQHLFTTRELKTARRRLADHGYEAAEPPAPSTPVSSGTVTEWYVNYGHGLGRHWDDARRYGFVSAGGGKWFSGTLRKISPGDRLLVYAPQRGYVGIARATRGAVPFLDAVVDPPGTPGVRLAELELNALYTHKGGTPDDDMLEYVVSVVWLATTSLEDAFKQEGLVANQNSAVLLRPDNARHQDTITQVLAWFGLDGTAG